tara:strand:- start:232861 stop:233088 length:228 start_codon:yes stop_codon:yes gene_type:complete
VTDDCHVSGTMAFSQARLIVLENEFEGPLKCVFGSPLVANAMTSLFGRSIFETALDLGAQSGLIACIRYGKSALT